MRVMISCGEASGDLYAAALATELARRVPGIEIVGLGGPRLRETGAQLVGDFGGLSVTGLTAPLRVAPRALLLLRRLVREARRRPPDVFVPVDFSGFNFRLMAALHRLGIPIVYYVSPQLWAWRQGRMRRMQAHVDRVLVIFPFEPEVYRRAGVRAEFVGHPLVDLARPTEPRDTFLAGRGLRPDRPTVALLPGSRPAELRRIAPALAAAVPLIRSRVPDVQFVVARAPGLADAHFAPFAAPSSAGGPAASRSSAGPCRTGSPGAEAPVVVEGRTDDAIAASDVVVTASGTATVQCALHGRPMVVVYRVSPVEYRVGRRFLAVDTYAMPNLIAGARIVPELIQHEFTPQRVADEAVVLLTDERRRAHMVEDLRRVREQLGSPGASGRAAEAVLDAVRGAGIA